MGGARDRGRWGTGRRREMGRWRDRGDGTGKRKGWVERKRERELGLGKNKGTFGMGMGVRGQWKRGLARVRGKGGMERGRRKLTNQENTG